MEWSYLSIPRLQPFIRAIVEVLEWISISYHSLPGMWIFVKAVFKINPRYQKKPKGLNMLGLLQLRTDSIKRISGI